MNMQINDNKPQVNIHATSLPKKTSLLHRLQVQTLPNATPQIGKIHQINKIAVTFYQLNKFYALCQWLYLLWDGSSKCNCAVKTPSKEMQFHIYISGLLLFGGF